MLIPLAEQYIFKYQRFPEDTLKVGFSTVVEITKLIQ